MIVDMLLGVEKKSSTYTVDSRNNQRHQVRHRLPRRPPSSGKSFLVNLLCGGKVSIVSAAPQTTRNRVRGILTGERGQLVFLDTPGIYLSEKKINLRLQGVVRESLADSDLALYVVDVSGSEGEEERAVRALLTPRVAPLVVALDKIDLAADRGAAALAAARVALRRRPRSRSGLLPARGKTRSSTPSSRPRRKATHVPRRILHRPGARL